MAVFSLVTCLATSTNAKSSELFHTDQFDAKVDFQVSTQEFLTSLGGSTTRLTPTEYDFNL